MPTISPKNTKPRIMPEPDTYIARVVKFILIGTVIEKNFSGIDEAMTKVRITFELPDCLHVFKEGEAAKPLVHEQDYTLSMFKKSNLRKLVEAVIGVNLTDEEADGFDTEKILNGTCLISLGWNEKHTYMKANAYSKLMKGQAAKLPFNELKILTYEKWDEKYFETLPNFIKDKMKTSVEYKQMKGILPETTEIDPNEIPF